MSIQEKHPAKDQMNPETSAEEVILITGVAGFIGSFLASYLLKQGKTVVGMDNLNDYYDVGLKQERLRGLEPYQARSFTFIQADVADQAAVEAVFSTWQPKLVVHLAAQAGVRYSMENPRAYIESNIVGVFNILEACRQHPVAHLVYASSSSVYGANQKVPFAESDPVDHPVSLYAATKKADELMAYTYSHLYNLPTTGLRFFTVYGPMGRPDMAYFMFTDQYFAGKPIRIYNNGDFAQDLYRDFTYVDDIVEGVARVLVRPPQESPPATIYNIGNNQPIRLMTFIETLESCLSRSLGRPICFERIYEPIKPGDVPATYADTSKLEQAIGFKPQTDISSGLQRFTDWYVAYYQKV